MFQTSSDSTCSFHTVVIPDPQTYCSEAGLAAVAIDRHQLRARVLPAVMKEFRADMRSPPVRTWKRHFFWQNDLCIVSCPVNGQFGCLQCASRVETCPDYMFFQVQYTRVPDDRIQTTVGGYTSVCSSERVEMQLGCSCRLVLQGVLDRQSHNGTWYWMGVCGNDADAVVKVTRRLCDAIARDDRDDHLHNLHAVGFIRPGGGARDAPPVRQRRA